MDDEHDDGSFPLNPQAVITDNCFKAVLRCQKIAADNVGCNERNQECKRRRKREDK